MSPIPAKPAVQTVYGGRRPTISVTFAAQPALTDTLTVNGVVVGFVANGASVPAGQNKVPLGTDVAGTVAALRAFLTASQIPALSALVYGANAGVLTIKGGTTIRAANAARVAVASSAANAVVAPPNLGGTIDADEIGRGSDVVHLATVAGGAMTFDLRDGLEGQRVSLFSTVIANGSNAIVRGTFGGGVLTFTAAGQYAVLECLGGVWRAIALSGATLA